MEKDFNLITRTQTELADVEKALQYRNKINKQREEFRETMGQMLFAFMFVMLQILGVYVIFAV